MGTTKECPLCRGKIKYCLSNLKCPRPACVTDLAKLVPYNGDIIKAVRQIIKKQTNPEKISALITQVGQQLPGYVTVDEAESVLQELINKGTIHYSVRNMMVRLCNQPWAVDRNLATHGLCYYGNFGETPSLSQAIDILRRNHGDEEARNHFHGS